MESVECIVPAQQRPAAVSRMQSYILPYGCGSADLFHADSQVILITGRLKLILRKT